MWAVPRRDARILANTRGGTLAVPRRDARTFANTRSGTQAVPRRDARTLANARGGTHGVPRRDARTLANTRGGTQAVPRRDVGGTRMLGINGGGTHTPFALYNIIKLKGRGVGCKCQVPAAVRL